MNAPGTRHSAESCKRQAEFLPGLILSIRRLRIWSKLLTLEVEVETSPILTIFGS